MKKVIRVCALAIFALMMAAPAQAQLKFGLKGGVNLSKVDFGDIQANKKNSTGFFIGPMAEVTIPVVGLGIDAALMYSQRGNVTAVIDGTENTFKQSGLEVPVHLKYTIGLGSLFGIYLAAGPNFFYNFKENNWDNLDLSEKKTQVAIDLGVGVKLIKHLQVGINYQIGMGDSFSLENVVNSASQTVTGKAKTNTWQVSAAYIF
ncbi:MAG: porin family protein [Prevotellaceae bacterium]|jgi:opacity protein-like surface antigen|nr:porin family protein [Prevotellaceae bacterium]